MTNALFNDNRLKLGVFGLNVSNGCAATTAEGHLQPTWQNNLDIAVMADRAGIEALVPVSSIKATGTQLPTWRAADAGPDRRARASVCVAPAGAVTSWSAPPEQIVDRLIHLTAMGLDGVVLSWVNYEAELAYWISDVLPVMAQASLHRRAVRGSDRGSERVADGRMSPYER